MKIVPFRPQHMLEIETHEWDKDFGLHYEGEAYTVIVNGKVIACIGVVPSGEAWAALSKHSGKHMLALTRAVLRWLQINKQPLEALIIPEFAAANRWATMLGFTFADYDRETGMHRYVR